MIWTRICGIESGTSSALVWYKAIFCVAGDCASDGLKALKLVSRAAQSLTIGCWKQLRNVFVLNKLNISKSRTVLETT